MQGFSSNVRTYFKWNRTNLFSHVNVLIVSHAGLKSMVVQGVKNPLVDLLSLEDKTLDEVRLDEMINQSHPHHTTQKSFTCIAFFFLSVRRPQDLVFSVTQGYGVSTAPPSTSNSNRTVKESSNAAIIKRFNHHSAMVLAAGSRKG